MESTQNEAELSLLLNAVEPGVFQFIIVRHNHLSLVSDVENALHTAYPDRKISRVRLPLGYREGIQYKVVAQESGFLLVDNFEKILEDDSARVNFNQRRDLLSQYPIALIVFIPDSLDILLRLQRGIKDFWSIRNLEIELRREGERIQGLEWLSDLNALHVSGSWTEKIEEIERLKSRIADLETDRSTLGYRAQMANQIGRLFHSMSQYDDAIEWYERTRTLFIEIGDRRGECLALNNLSNVFVAKGNYEKALDYIQTGLNISNEDGLRSSHGVLLNAKGALLMNKGQMQEALICFDESLHTLDKYGAKAELPAVLNNIAHIKAADGAYEAAKNYLDRSLEIVKYLNDRVGESHTTMNLALLANYRKDYASALHFLRMSEQIFQEIGDLSGIGQSLFNLGFVSFEIGEYENALLSCLKASLIFQKIGQKKLEQDARQVVDLLAHLISPTRYQEIIASNSQEDKPHQ